jgi:hypothetical protein
MAENKGGRPSIYSQELTDTICARIADGQSLRRICRDEGTPGLTTIFMWLREYPEFRDQYELAKSSQADAMEEDMLDIADTPPAMTADGKVDSADVAHMRLRIDTRKWIASKLKPKKYGDKIEQEIKGEVGLTVQIVRMSDQEEK